MTVVIVTVVPDSVAPVALMATLAVVKPAAVRTKALPAAGLTAIELVVPRRAGVKLVAGTGIHGSVLVKDTMPT